MKPLTKLLSLLLGVTYLHIPLHGFAQEYPNKPIRIVLPFPPGGGADVLMRPLSKKLTEILGQPILLDNRPQGEAIEANFKLIETPVPALQEGQVLVKHHFLSLDPYMRGRMYDRPSYVPPFQIGQALQLVGNRLRLHGHGRRQLPNRQLVSTHQSMQQSQSRLIRQHAKYRCQPTSLHRRQQRSLRQRQRTTTGNNGSRWPPSFTDSRRHK